MLYLYLYFLIVSLVSFVVVGCDKYYALNHKRRIPETTLLTWSFIGGSVGAGIGMWVFNHKTSKRSFLWKFWCIVLLQLLLVLALYYFEIIGIY
jgi:uncharacterized membrane protein YsdA (DUF1294 family)